MFGATSAHGEAGMRATRQHIGIELAGNKRPDGATTLPFSLRDGIVWDATACILHVRAHVPAHLRSIGVGLLPLSWPRSVNRANTQGTSQRSASRSSAPLVPASVLLNKIAYRIFARVPASLALAATVPANIPAAIQMRNAACILEALAPNNCGDRLHSSFTLTRHSM